MIKQEIIVFNGLANEVDKFDNLPSESNARAFIRVRIGCASHPLCRWLPFPRGRGKFLVSLAARPLDDVVFLHDVEWFHTHDPDGLVAPRDLFLLHHARKTGVVGSSHVIFSLGAWIVNDRVSPPATLRAEATAVAGEAGKREAPAKDLAAAGE